MSYQSLKPSENNANLTHPVDARLRHISQTILPSTPYLLTIPPTDFCVGPHQLREWRKGCPFEAHEEQLQYLAFLNHQNEDTMYRVLGDWDDGHGNIKPPQDKRSGTNSPLPGQPAKKKISLLDYKNKANGQSAAKASTQKVAETPPKSTENPKPSQTPATEQADGAREKPQGVKRPIDTMETPTAVESQVIPPRSPPNKKARKSPKDAQVSEKPPVFTLPPLLSPNLPADIEEELLKLSESKENTAHQSSTSDVASLPSKKASSHQITQTEKAKAAKLSEKNTTTTAKNSERTTAKDSPRETKGQKSLTPSDLKAVTVNGVTKAHSIPNENASATEKEKTTHVTPGAVRLKSEQQRQSLILKLRIPKAIRKNCARILNMKPRQQKNVDQCSKKSLNNKIPGDEPNPKTKEGLALASISAEKRRRPEDDAGAIVEPANKRPKHPDHLDLSNKPRTPSKPPVLSPVLSQHGSAQKSHLATPLDALKGPAMRRIGSSEGDVTTPLGATRGSTPVASIASDRINREARSASSASSSDTSNRDRTNLLKTDQSKFAALGRKLKHEAQNLIRTEPEWKIDTPDTKQGAALAFEALLAFMLSFALKDEISHAHGLLPDVTAWRSILSYVNWVKMATQLYPPLRGLVHQLEAVCRDAIVIGDTYRLEGDSFLRSLQDDPRPSTATSNGAGSPSVEEKAKSKKDFLEFRTEHARNLREAQQAWQLGYSKLSVRELQRTFPKSWAKSTEVPGLGKTKDEITYGNYLEAAYYLPLGPTTACSEAVRAGWSMLEEWCGKEDLKWEGKLGL